MKKAHLIGLGALGSIYAAQILKSNSQALEIIATGERVNRYKTQGLKVNQEHFDLSLATPEMGPAELIIIAVKYPQLMQAMEDMAPFVGANTTILSLLNGISSEEILIQRFGEEKVIYAYGIEMDARRVGDEIIYKSLGRIVFGEKKNLVKSSRIQEIESFFLTHHVPYEIPPDMIKSQWFKFMLNAGVNQASTMLKAPFKEFHQEGKAKDLMINIAQEVVLISQALGINLNQLDIERMVEIINRLNPEGRTSMLQDLDAGRVTEVDYFAAKIMELGKKLGIPTPYNEAAYKMITGL